VQPEIGLFTDEPDEIRRLSQRPVEPRRGYFQPFEIDVPTFSLDSPDSKRVLN
jgi:hypothetical protein